MVIANGGGHGLRPDSVETKGRPQVLIRRRTKMVATALVTMAIAGCSSDDSSSNAPSVSYAMSATASTAGETVSVDGTTNLPDDTTLSLSGILGTRDQGRVDPGSP